MAKTLRAALNNALEQLTSTPLERLLERRYERLLHYGELQEH
jgi:acetyl-CoA carboxylase alpha subunit